MKHDEDTQVSGYPSDGMAANVSKDTNVSEVISIGDMTLDDYRLHNINLMFGEVNAIEYGSEMMKFPTIYDIRNQIG